MTSFLLVLAGVVVGAVAMAYLERRIAASPALTSLHHKLDAVLAALRTKPAA